MRAAITLRNVIGVAERSLLVAVAPLQCQLDLHVTTGLGKIQHGRVDGCLVAIQVVYEGPDSALEVKLVVTPVAFVPQVDMNARVQEGKLPESLCKNVIVELDIGKNCPAGLETYGRAGFTRA